MAAPRKDNIKEKILQATTELLKTTALAEISLAEIAAAAGISKGTLYYHYKMRFFWISPSVFWMNSGRI